MCDITIEEYCDGISFFVGDYEIAFYSTITCRVDINNYGIEKAYPDYKCVYGASMPVEAYLRIAELIKDLKNKNRISSENI